MNNVKSSLLIFTIIASYQNMFGFGQKTFFDTRSQGVNLVREIVGWQRLIHKSDQEHCYTAFAITPEYSRSFDNKKIAQFLFGCSSLIFSGSRVVHERSCDEILADYFGLPSDFKSVVCFEPVITNFVMDLNWYLGLDSWVLGLYVRAHVPIVHTKWDLNMVECVIDQGTTFTSYPAGYFAIEAIELSALPKSVKKVFEGKTTFGDMREPLKFGKIFGRQTIDRVAELQLAVGYNFLLSDWYHFGLLVRTSAPTGNSSKAEFLFEPIAGNGGHWEFGGGFTSYVQLFQSSDQVHQIALYADGIVTHLFTAKEKRSFDFKKNCPGGRYMLLEQITPPAEILNIDVAPNNELAPNQYRGRLVPVINETTLDTIISIDVQADVVVKLAYQRKGLEIDFGYNFWVRSKEQLHCRDCFLDCFALKGDAQVYGFTNPAETPIALNGTQDCATIHAGQGEGNFVAGVEFENRNADNPIIASDDAGIALFQVTTADAATFGIAQGSVRTSNPAILLQDCDIDEQSGLLPRALSHKVFVHVNHQWDCISGLTPFFGIGASAEWACPDVCSNSAHSQFAVWAKGGIAY